jgi:hypothetical protein
VGFCVSDVAIPFSDAVRNIAMLGVRGLRNSDICSSSQGLHEHIQATVMPEIITKINQLLSLKIQNCPSWQPLALSTTCFYELLHECFAVM